MPERIFFSCFSCYGYFLGWVNFHLQNLLSHLNQRRWVFSLQKAKQTFHTPFTGHTLTHRLVLFYKLWGKKKKPFKSYKIKSQGNSASRFSDLLHMTSLAWWTAIFTHLLEKQLLNALLKEISHIQHFSSGKNHKEYLWKQIKSAAHLWIDAQWGCKDTYWRKRITCIFLCLSVQMHSLTRVWPAEPMEFCSHSGVCV